MQSILSKTVLSLFLVLSVCSGGNNATNSNNQTGNQTKGSNVMSDPDYVLPPMPDKEENDKTLLGIDSNNNGIRDDVEIWIHENSDHPIRKALYAQIARDNQKILTDIVDAKEKMYTDKTNSCYFYWRRKFKENSKGFQFDDFKSIYTPIDAVCFNTVDRYLRDKRYNSQFHGEILSAPKASIDNCEFDEFGNFLVK
ncbi:MAG: hypothetical protein LBG67_03585 [Campylobacteraceae bacterium]|jgi:hypothetical protein|nr:hypothetical protein [Campylobacteraceae bacterium]